VPRAPDFFSQMSRAELDQLEAFAREPGRTIDACHEWLLARGYTASRSAVGSWKKKFDESDRIRAATDLSDAIHTAAAECPVDVAGAVNLQIAQRLQAAIVKGGDGLSVKELLACSIAINQLTTSQKRVRQMLAEKFDAEVKKLQSRGPRQITQDDLLEVRKAMFGV
jgi:hypothetical protein